VSRVIDIRDRLPPRWGATVSLDDGGAALSGFWGSDGIGVPERCIRVADMLEKLAVQLRETAEACDADR